MVKFGSYTFRRRDPAILRPISPLSSTGMIFHINRVAYFESLYNAFKCVISLLAHHISNQRNEPL